jgi:hypothetical protein
MRRRQGGHTRVLAAWGPLLATWGTLPLLSAWETLPLLAAWGTLPLLAAWWTFPLLAACGTFPRLSDPTSSSIAVMRLRPSRRLAATPGTSGRSSRPHSTQLQQCLPSSGTPSSWSLSASEEKGPDTSRNFRHGCGSGSV